MGALSSEHIECQHRNLSTKVPFYQKHPIHNSLFRLTCPIKPSCTLLVFLSTLFFKSSLKYGDHLKINFERIRDKFYSRYLGIPKWSPLWKILTLLFYYLKSSLCDINMHPINIFCKIYLKLCVLTVYECGDMKHPSHCWITQPLHQPSL